MSSHRPSPRPANTTHDEPKSTSPPGMVSHLPAPSEPNVYFNFDWDIANAKAYIEKIRYTLHQEIPLASISLIPI